MGNNWKAHSWLPMVLKESSREVVTQNTWNLGGSIFPTEFSIYSCSGWASLEHLISEIWNRSQQRLSIVGVVGFSQTKACSSLSHASACCSLAQEVPWEVVQLRLWRSKCSFHFTTTGLFQRLSEVFALIGFCWGTQDEAPLPEQKFLCIYLYPPGSIQSKCQRTTHPLNSSPALLIILLVIIKVSNPFYILNLLHF